MHEQVTAIIKVKQDNSGGHCGVYLSEITQSTGFEIKELKTALNELIKKGIITHCQGVHGVMLKMKR